MGGDKDAKDEWVRQALGVAAEVLALRKASPAPVQKQTAEAEGKDANNAKKAKKRPPPKPAPDEGTKGKFGNALHRTSRYVVSLPPNPSGKFPLVVIFAGDTGEGVIEEATPANYYTKAIVVIGPRDGKFAEVTALLAPLLKDSHTEIGSTTICGYSSGGRAAFANYDKADKAVGLIDPNVHKSDFAKFDSKTIYSFYDPNPEAWNFPADPDDKKYTVGQARIDAFDLVKKAGGFAEKTKQSHEGYPKYFLAKFESKLI